MPTPSLQSHFSYEDLLRCAEGELFGSDAPRLPLPPMLMLDRVTAACSEGGVYGKGEIVAEKEIRPDLWFFACHFRGDPVMPGCLGLDGLWQLAGFFLGFMGYRGQGRALGVGEVRFSDQITPTVRRLVYRVHPKRIVSRAQLIIAGGEIEADGRLVYRAEDMKVIAAPSAAPSAAPFTATAADSAGSSVQGEEQDNE
ncbi:MAG: bifunctional 3-hydroxydecanoyl-ACP dehydratase/trans-2-decenoyl-ACP isomerase [Alphaproteobacteria bacterium]